MLLLYTGRHKKHAKAAKRQDFHLIGCFVIPHSASNAIFLPNVIRYNAAATDRFPDLARVIGKQTMEELAQAIETLRAEANNQSETKEFGI